MAIDFRYVELRFDPTSGQVQRLQGTATFDRTVKKAVAAINGFKIGYSRRDRWFKRMTVNVHNHVEVSGNAATCAASFELVDQGESEDFDGYVDVLIIAEVED